MKKLVNQAISNLQTIADRSNEPVVIEEMAAETADILNRVLSSISAAENAMELAQMMMAVCEHAFSAPNQHWGVT